MIDSLASDHVPSTTGMNPPLSDRHLRAIERAIRAAWQLILTDRAASAIVGRGREVPITKLMLEHLERLRIHGGSPGYDASSFERPMPAPEFYDYQETRVRKPDLVFFLSGQPRPGVVDSLYDGLAVECKVIGVAAATVAEYSRAGIRRFVDGGYGWRMNQGMMCAYVFSAERLPTALEGYFQLHAVSDRLSIRDLKLVRSRLTSEKPYAYLSRHDRSWKFQDGTAPGDIELRHLWLTVV